MEIILTFPPLPPDHRAEDGPVYWLIRETSVKQNGDCEGCKRENVIVFHCAYASLYWLCWDCAIKAGAIEQMVF